jgi:hypothetical protein
VISVRRLAAVIAPYNYGATQRGSKKTRSAKPEFREANLLCGIAQQLAGRTVDEMQPGASLTDDRFVGALRIVRSVCQPMLHVQPGQRTFEKDMAHSSFEGFCRAAA